MKKLDKQKKKNMRQEIKVRMHRHMNKPEKSSFNWTSEWQQMDIRTDQISFAEMAEMVSERELS